MRESRIRMFFWFTSSVFLSLVLEIYDQLRAPFTAKNKGLNLLRMRPWLDIPIKEKDGPKVRKRK